MIDARMSKNTTVGGSLLMRRIVCAIFAIGLAALGPLELSMPAHAEPDDKDLRQLFGNVFNFADSVTMNTDELRAVGCMVVAGGVGAAALGFGGTIMAFTGLPNVTAGVAAVPVLATSMWAGCGLGSTAAPGVAWMFRNSEALFRKVGNAIPANPVSMLIPQTPHSNTPTSLN